MKKYFITGLITILPLTITVLIIVFLVNKIGGLLMSFSNVLPAVTYLPPYVVTILGLFIVFIGITFIGLITQSVVGKIIFEWIEKILTHLPIVKTIYTSINQLTSSLFGSKHNFREVVLVEFPRRNSWSIGFVTSEEKWIIDGEKYINIFVPTTPNPTSGYYIIVAESDVVKTPYTVEWGLKIVMSAGVILPSKREIEERKLLQ